LGTPQKIYFAKIVTPFGVVNKKPTLNLAHEKSRNLSLKPTLTRLNKANELILRLLSKNQNKAIAAMAPEPKPKVSFW
jgi:hypothetical protein